MKLYKSFLAIALGAITLSSGLTSCSEDYDYPPVILPDLQGEGTSVAPYTVTTAIYHIVSGQYTARPVYVKGVVTDIEEASFNVSYGNLTYYIGDSEDSASADWLEVYRGSGLFGEKFTSAYDLKIGDEVVILASLTYYNNSVAETQQGAKIVSLNGSEYPQVENADPEGTGSIANPFNVEGALQALYAGNVSATPRTCVRGVVTKIENIDTSYGNATYFIGDTGESLETIEIYRGKYLNGEKFSSENDLKVGDEVLVKGTLELYNDATPEYTTGSIILSLNGSAYDVPQEAEPVGTGKSADPYNVQGALDALYMGQVSTSDPTWVKGYVTKVESIDPSYGNAVYYIGDFTENCETIEVFRGRFLDGDRFTSEDQLKQGDLVIVKGMLELYKGTTPEFTAGSEIKSLNGSEYEIEPDLTTLYSGLVDNADGWTFDNVSLAEGLEYVWSWKTYNNSGYLNASAYANGSKAATAYAYVAVDLTGYTGAYLSFEHAAKFQTSLRQLCCAAIRVEGETAWTDLQIPSWPEAGAWTFAASGSIDISAFAGKKVQVGLKYGSTDENADTWEIKNFVVTGK